MTHLRRTFLERRVHEHAIGILVPRRLEARLQILELHAFEHRIVEDATIARVVVEYRAVPILFRRPEVRPFGPERVAAEVCGKQSMKMR